MIVTCTNCSTRLQLDDAKIPPRPFNVRCPKCQNTVNVQPGGEQDHSALAVGESPAMSNPRFKQQATAPTYGIDSETAEVEASSGNDTNELLRALTMLLQRNAQSSDQTRALKRPAWDRRRALVCVTPVHREQCARVLAASNYQVFVAEDTTQALESLREEHVDVVLLDPGFDPVEQGAAFVTSEVNSMRPSERRRLFLIQLSASVRTLDAHTAFVNNVNMVLNPADIETLPQSLERSLRNFNELYRDFNGALGLNAI